jgi:hypothetical protein
LEDFGECFCGFCFKVLQAEDVPYRLLMAKDPGWDSSARLNDANPKALDTAVGMADIRGAQVRKLRDACVRKVGGIYVPLNSLEQGKVGKAA